MQESRWPKQETMSPGERMGALLMRQRPDRVPWLPFAFGFCAISVGYDVASVYTDAEKSFWAQLWSQEMYGWDGGPLYGYASAGAWEFGGAVKMPETEFDQAPTITKLAASTPEEVEALEIPDVETAGAYPIHIEFSKLQQQFGMPITVFGQQPFTNAGNMIDVNNLCRWMIKMPEAVHTLMRKIVQFHKKIIDYFQEEFPDHPKLVFNGEPTAANQVISPKAFEEFALPYIIETCQYNWDKGIKNTFFHICGEQNANLELWTQVNFGDPGICSFGHEVDLTKAIEMFGDKNIIAGNVMPTVIQMGKGQEVYELTKTCVEKAKHAPSGYCLMPGCDVPVYSPPYNVFSMKKALMDYGFYD